jgi:hypothetical protein
MPRRLDLVNLIDPIVTGLYARMRNFVCLFGEEYSYTVHLDLLPRESLSVLVYTDERKINNIHTRIVVHDENSIV